MQPRELLHVLHSQRLARLIAVDCLVLRAVVLEHAADAAHKGDAPYIEEEHEEADAALDEVEHNGIVRIRGSEMRRSRRDDDEEHTRKDECKEDRQRDLLLCHLLVLLARRLCREREGTHADDEGLDHDNRAANQRQVEDWIAVTDRRDGMRLHFDFPVWEAHGGRGLIRVAHHDPLDDRLPADRKVSNFLWHRISFAL